MTIVTGDLNHIGLNAHLLNLSGNYRSAGINWYIYHLLQNLPTVPDLKFTVFLSESRARNEFGRLSIAQSRWPTRRPMVRILWEQFIQPAALRREHVGLLHALAFAGPVAISIPWVATIYDLSFVRYPQSFNTLNRSYLTWAVRDSLRRAKRIIAISESTKRDLIELFGAKPDQIAVIHCGTDLNSIQRASPIEIETLRARRHLPEEMILHVGTIEPRKNLVRLIHAFALAKRIAHIPHSLVLIGARGWRYTQVDQALEQEGIAESVIFAGYIPQDELPLWYQAAQLFVYPSMYEGFGLPPLDAMACGLPVVTSNAASIPEVVGDAAIQVPPEDVQAIADAIIRVVTDAALREQMTHRSILQAARFTWKKTAAETVSVYRSVLTESAHGAAYAA